MDSLRVASLIDQSPMNRGLVGLEWTNDPNNVFIADGENVMLFERDRINDTANFHWLHMGTRGRKAIRDTQSAFIHMFCFFGVRVIYGEVPRDRKDSALMARLIGAREFPGRFPKTLRLFYATKPMIERKV